MAGISGSGIDKMLYPSPYAQDDAAVKRYHARAGVAVNGQPAVGVAAGGRNFRDQTAMQRIQAQQNQAQAYGQMMAQFAQLAAYMKMQQGPGQMGEQSQMEPMAQRYQDPFDPRYQQQPMMPTGPKVRQY